MKEKKDRRDKRRVSNKDEGCEGIERGKIG